MSELEHYTGNVWMHILSLHREDAERLGYNNAQAWRALIRAHRNDIAAAMHIPPQDFRWYAAFHKDVYKRQEHHNSPLADEDSTIYFASIDALCPERRQQLLAALSEMDVCRRNRVIFSCVCQPGEYT